MAAVPAMAVLLDHVHRYWVRGVLEKSLYQEARIELGMTVTVDAPHPWDVVVASPDGSSRVVPAGTTMAEAFDELDQTTLVLGEPGSGKTTMMLELARELLQRAGTDAAHPIPVVLTLSSWALRREPLGDWIVHELAARYEIPTAQARLWLRADQLIPLLDGLDEVAEEHQQVCVATINDFRAERGATRLLVCCRTADYERLREPLRTYGTLTIQPLTRMQVEDFLARAGEPVAAVRAVLAADSLLWELIQSPLLHSIAMLAYRDAAVGTVATSDDTQQLRDRLFATYVRTMLARRRSNQHSARQTVRRLAFLATRMKSNSQTVFTPELLDAWVLRRRRWERQRLEQRRLAVRSSLICGLAGGLVLGAAALVAYGWRGGVAGAMIGAAVGLPYSERIGTRDYYSYRDALDVGDGGSGVDSTRFSTGSPSAARSRAFSDSWITPAPCGSPAAPPLCWCPFRLVRRLGHRLDLRCRHGGCGTHCGDPVYGYGASVIHVQAVVLPREGSGEIPSPIARAIMRRGLLAALVVALVTPILPGLLVAWPGTSADGYRFAAVVAVGAAMLTLMWLGGFGVLEQIRARGDASYHVCCRRPLDIARVLGALVHGAMPFSLDFFLPSATDSIAAAENTLPLAYTVFANAAEYELLTDAIPARDLPEVLVTDGPRPAQLIRSGRCIARVTPPRVTTVDVTGSGDTLAGTFLAARAIGLDDTAALECAVRAASAHAASPTRQLDG